jgi:hypothetical protein
MPVVALTLTDSGHNFFRDCATGVDQWTHIYGAVGNGTSTPTHLQTTLDNEQSRKKITNALNGASVGEVLFNCFLSDSDAVGLDIEEIAVFAGLSASSSSNSGKMLGRALWTHNPKTSIESIQLTLDLQL